MKEDRIFGFKLPDMTTKMKNTINARPYNRLIKDR
jgi:hypothetical protein